jgi:dTDP-4-dehydrorhamnose reductase
VSRGPVLVIGANGQLGADLMRVFGAGAVGATHADLDVCDGDRVAERLRALRPAAVVNTAAYHHTGQCEQDPRRSFDVNALGPLHLARGCEEVGALFVHVSSDYVFDGSKRAPYVETDPVSPLNVYGLSKVAGEQAVLAYCRRHYVVRSCGLYGIDVCRAKGENFVSKMLRLAREQGQVTVVDDEIVTPTWTFALARQIRRLCTSDGVPHGIVHATSQGHCSWYEFAAEIFRQAGVDAKLGSARVADFPSPIRRPHYSVLENRVLAAAGADELPDWQSALSQHLAWLLHGREPAAT